MAGSDRHLLIALISTLNKSWRQHPTRHQLYGHLPPITKTIQVRRTRHAGHYWRSKDELISDVLIWTPAYGRAKAGRPARTYIQQLCEDTGCNPEDLTKAMNDREEWREKVRDIRAGGMTWWWWWWWSLPFLIIPRDTAINGSVVVLRYHIIIIIIIIAAAAVAAVALTLNNPGSWSIIRKRNQTEP